MKPEKCLVCGEAVQKSADDSKHFNTSFLEKQLRVIFVLRQLLDLPLESLEKCFQLSDGQNPASWVTICGGQCQEIVDNAQSAYQEMCRSRRKMIVYQKEIRDKIKSSSTTAITLYTAIHFKDYRAPILKLIRERVKVDENAESVSLSEDFAAGDRMANQLLTLKAAIISNHHSEVPCSVPKLEAENESSTPFDDDMTFTTPSLVEVKPNVNLANQNKFKCPQCDYLGKTQKLVRSHQVMVHPKDDSTFQCNLCQQSFNTPTRLTKHKWNVHKRPTMKKNKFACRQCDYTTNQGSHHLTRHMHNKHGSAYDFTCNICNRKFKEPGDMRRHQAWVHNKCSVKNCDKICESREDLRDHQMSVHGREINVIKCPECDKFLQQKNCLKHHLMAYHRKGNEKVYVCGQCHKSFLTEPRLRGHMRETHEIKRKEKKVQEEEKDEHNLILGI